MADYFDISFILKKDNCSKEEIDNFIKTNKLKYGCCKTHQNQFPFNAINDRDVLISYIEDGGETDFHEVCFSFVNQLFHKDSFEHELNQITKFIDFCFMECECLFYAFCSYELNGYLLRSIKNLKDIDGDVIKAFPISYVRQSGTLNVKLILNMEAQNIFVM